MSGTCVCAACGRGLSPLEQQERHCWGCGHRRTVPTPPAEAPTAAEIEREIQAMQRCVEALNSIGREHRPRVLRYLWDRYVDHPSQADAEPKP